MHKLPSFLPRIIMEVKNGSLEDERLVSKPGHVPLPGLLGKQDLEDHPDYLPFDLQAIKRPFGKGRTPGI